MKRRWELTVVGRMTAWFSLLFACAATAIVGFSYALLSRSFNGAASTIVDPFTALGLPRPPPDAQAQLSALLGSDLGVLVQAAVRKTQNDALDELARRSLTILAVSIVVATAGAWWLARRSMRPVARITDLAHGISEANLHDRIALAGPPDELRRLADTFDVMLARLDDAFNAQRGFAANASHELRTPLTTLGAEADIVLATSTSAEARQLAIVARSTVDRADRLISGLLAVSRAESGLVAHERVDLAELTGDVIAELAQLASACDVHLDLELGEAMVTGDAALLRAMVANIARNAIQYNGPIGTVDVGVSTIGDRVQLRVVNTGPALSLVDVRQMSKPFARGDQFAARVPGSGVGIAVITAVTSAHGGGVDIEPRPGGGLIVVVELPAAG